MTAGGTAMRAFVETAGIALIALPIVAAGVIVVDTVLREADRALEEKRAESDRTAIIAPAVDAAADPHERFRAITILLRLGGYSGEAERLEQAVPALDLDGRVHPSLRSARPAPRPAQGRSGARDEGTATRAHRGYAASASLPLMASPSPAAETCTVSPSVTAPSSSIEASGFCNDRWITRLSGRAP
jgi:hypothetical protein